MRFDRVLVKAEGDGFTAVATVDAEGTFDGVTQVSYLGLERVPFVRRHGRWEPREALLPALEEAVRLLLARRAALAATDSAALEHLAARRWKDPQVTREAALAQTRERIDEFKGRYQATRWIVRVERDGAEVLEQYTLAPPDAPVRKGQIRFELVREDAGLRFGSPML